MKGVVQIKSDAILNTTKAAEAHWREKRTVMEVTHSAKRHTASAKLRKPRRTEAVWWARVVCAEMANAVMQKCVKKLMTKKDRLMVQCAELASENQFVRGLAKEVKEARELCVEV